jgi:hypothetical protein
MQRMAEQKENNYLIRGEGKNKGGIKRKHFFAYYKKNAKSKLVPEKIYRDFLTDLLKELSTRMITENLEVRVPTMGKFRIQTRPTTFLKQDGTLCKSLRPDWIKTWEYWEDKYPGLTRQEITEIKGKKVIYHTNEHTGGDFCSHLWDKENVVIRYHSFFKFTAPRQYCRLLAKTVKDPNRKVFYYG